MISRPVPLIRFTVYAAMCLFAAASAFAVNSALVMDGDRGDYLLTEQHRYYVSPGAVFAANKNQHNGVTIHVSTGSECWALDFSAPNYALLQTGQYDNAMRYPFEVNDLTQPSVRPGLDVSGGSCAIGQGCNILKGSFVVRELVFAADGTVTSFHATFIQSCEEHAPPLRGEVFYNSADPLPPAHRILSPDVSYSTKGQFFRYQITSTEHGSSYEAPGLPPGLSLDSFTGLISGAPTKVGTGPIQLSVVAPTATVTKTWTLVTTPAYESTGPFTAVRIFSEPGEPVGKGQTYLLTPDDGTVTAYTGGYFGATGMTSVSIYFRPWTSYSTAGTVGDPSGYWSIQCSAPSGQQITEGSYSGATTDMGGGPRIYLTQWNSSPWAISGNFTVFEVANDSINRLEHFRGVLLQQSSNVPPWLHVWAWFNAENVVTSDVRANARQGFPFQYQIVANNHPTGFAATGLPTGLSVDPSTGLISGIPETSGDFKIDLAANGAVSNAAEVLELHVRPARSFKNIATRVRVGTGDNVVIGGFIISGPSSKRVLIRGIGPSLRAYGLDAVLEDPILELHDGSGKLIATNDDWTTQAEEVEAIGIPPSIATESAIVATLAPGAYTTILAGKNGTTGIGVVEIYDVDPASASMFGNISTRGRVGIGPDEVLIGGLIIGGGSEGASRVVIRAMGSRYGYGVPNELYDPTLELHDGNGTVIGSNDNWADTQRAEIFATMLAPSSDERAVHSALLVTLPPGTYTAIVRGKDNDQGLALVEAYNLDSN